MIRWFWRIYIPAAVIALAILLGLSSGEKIESGLFPPRIHNQNLQPTRYVDRVCWTWSSDKLRTLKSDNVDVFLDLLDAEGKVRNTFVPPLTRSDTGDPWQSGLVVPLGHHEFPYCVELPRFVKPTDHIRIRFTPIVHGLFDLWQIPIPTPDIVDPPFAGNP